MPTARHGLSAVAANDGKIYVIGGGREPGGSGSNLNEIFHVRQAKTAYQDVVFFSSFALHNLS